MASSGGEKNRGGDPAQPRSGGLHESLVRAEDIVGPSDRSFGLTIGAVCAVIGGIRALTGHGHAAWWLGAALIIVLFALLWPSALAPFNRLWLRIGLALNRVVSPIVMTVLFVATIVPIGVLLRLRGKDPLRLKPRPDKPTYWITREPSGPASETMKNQF